MASRPGWAVGKRLLLGAFLTIAAILVVRVGVGVDWHAVRAAIRGVRREDFAAALVCACSSYAVYGCVDLFAGPVLGIRLPPRTSVPIAFVCYAFNQNLGSWVGSIGFRYRLYSQFGLSPPQITAIVGLSLFTNWSGYFLLAGLSFLFNPLKLPEGWEIGTTGLQYCGAGLLVVLFAYLAAAAIFPRRMWKIRSTSFQIPSLRLAIAQVVLSTVIWLLIGATLFSLMHRYADFPTVLTVFFLASIAGAATHIPAGLGVIEAVFLGAFHGSETRWQLLAALLVYRVVYYLIPFGIAAATYLVLEAKVRRSTTAANVSGGTGTADRVL